MTSQEENKQITIDKYREMGLVEKRKYPPPARKARRWRPVTSVGLWLQAKVAQYYAWRCERCRRYLDLHDPEMAPKLEDIRVGMSEAERNRVIGAITSAMHEGSFRP